MVAEIFLLNIQRPRADGDAVALQGPQNLRVRHPLVAADRKAEDDIRAAPQPN